MKIFTLSSLKWIDFLQCQFLRALFNFLALYGTFLLFDFSFQFLFFQFKWFFRFHNPSYHSLNHFNFNYPRFNHFGWTLILAWNLIFKYYLSLQILRFYSYQESLPIQQIYLKFRFYSDLRFLYLVKLLKLFMTMKVKLMIFYLNQIFIVCQKIIKF
jgi:hypothetical protein